MNRRNFLSMMVGGVAAAAAVRTFPFRVFSFPKEIQRLEYPAMFGGDPCSLSLYGRLYWDDRYNPTGTHMGISRDGYVEQEIEMTVQEMKRRYPRLYSSEIIGMPRGSALITPAPPPFSSRRAR